MRENRQTFLRRPAPLPKALPVHSPEGFDLADKVVTVDGEEIALGDLWARTGYEAAMYRGGHHGR